MVSTASLGLIGRARGHKAIHCAVIPAQVLRYPIMRNVVSAGRVRYRSVEMEWQQFREWRGGGVGRVRLLKCCTLIGKTPDAAVASEVVIERTVFLDQDDHVVDVAQFCASGWDG